MPVLSVSSTLGVLPLSIAQAGLSAATPPAEEGSTESLWAELPKELQVMVLTKVLEAACCSATQAGLDFSRASASVRLVCAQWQAVHDGLVTRLVLSHETTDEAMGMLVRRFPAVASLWVEGSRGRGSALTDEGVQAVSSLRALTSLDLTGCVKITDEGVRAVSSCSAISSLNLSYCYQVTAEGMRVVSSLPALTSLILRSSTLTDTGLRAVSCCTALKTLSLWGCSEVTDEGVRAVVSSCTALKTLDLRACIKLTDVGVRALSSLPALTSLRLYWCYNITDEALRAFCNCTALKTLYIWGCHGVTAAGVQALRTAAPNLHIRTLDIGR
jgi:hypothetical protein